MTGFAFYERSLALYRYWELIDVLAAAVENLSPAEQQVVDQVRPLVAAGDRSEARKVLQTMPAGLPSDRVDCREIVEALTEALAVDS